LNFQQQFNEGSVILGSKTVSTVKQSNQRFVEEFRLCFQGAAAYVFLHF